MIRDIIRKPIFFWIQEALLLETLFPTVNLLRLLLCQWLQWLDLPDDLGQDLNMKNAKISMHIYDLYPPACRRLFWTHLPLAQLRLGLCSSSTEFWFGCQPASQPAAARVIPLISLIISATQQAASHAASQPYSQQQQLSQPPSQPASHPEPASLGIMMRLCAWRRFATLANTGQLAHYN